MRTLLYVTVGATIGALIYKNKYDIGRKIDDLLNPSPY
jgi:hypothetical protein